MFKKISPFIISTFACYFSFSQTISIDSLDYIAGIQNKNGALLIAGNTYRTDSTITSIAKFKSNNTVDWKIVFREGSYNTIDNFLVTNEAIYVNLLTGNSESRYDYFSAKRYVLILNNKGNIVDRIYIGNSWGGCSNFLLQDKKLFFTYKNASSSYRARIIADTSIFTILGLDANHQLVKKVSTSKFFTPESLLKTDSSIITLGNYDRYQNGSIREQLALIWKNDSLYEKVVESQYYENFGTSLLKNQSSILVISDFRFSSDSNYIRITSVNDRIDEQHSKYLYFKDSKWSWINNKITASKDGFWILVQKAKDNKYYLIKISFEGIIIQEKTYFLPYPQNSMVYFISGENIYFMVKNNLQTNLLIKNL